MGERVYVLFLGREVDGRVLERCLILAEKADELGNSPIELKRTHPMEDGAFVFDDDLNSLVEKRKFSKPVRKDLEAVIRGVEYI